MSSGTSPRKAKKTWEKLHRFYISSSVPAGGDLTSCQKLARPVFFLYNCSQISSWVTRSSTWEKKTQNSSQGIYSSAFQLDLRTWKWLFTMLSLKEDNELRKTQTKQNNKKHGSWVMQLSDNLSGAQNINFVVVIEWKNEYTSMKNALFLNRLVWNNLKKGRVWGSSSDVFLSLFPCSQQTQTFFVFPGRFYWSHSALKKKKYNSFL